MVGQSYGMGVRLLGEVMQRVWQGEEEGADLCLMAMSDLLQDQRWRRSVLYQEKDWYAGKVGNALVFAKLEGSGVRKLVQLGKVLERKITR